MIALNALVSQDHLLRKIDKLISCFIRDKVRDCNRPDHGRPAVDPVILFGGAGACY
ncbi:MAG: hypothetical protein ACRCR1_06320 [Aeromonas sp.]